MHCCFAGTDRGGTACDEYLVHRFRFEKSLTAALSIEKAVGNSKPLSIRTHSIAVPFHAKFDPPGDCAYLAIVSRGIRANKLVTDAKSSGGKLKTDENLRLLLEKRLINSKPLSV